MRGPGRNIIAMPFCESGPGCRRVKQGLVSVIGRQRNQRRERKISHHCPMAKRFPPPFRPKRPARLSHKKKNGFFFVEKKIFCSVEFSVR